MPLSLPHVVLDTDPFVTFEPPNLELKAKAGHLFVKGLVSYMLDSPTVFHVYVMSLKE